MPSPCPLQMSRTCPSITSFIHLSRRSYAYTPRPHSLSTPKPNKQLSNHSQDPTPYRQFLTTFASLPTPFPDHVAMQIFTHKSYSHGKLGYNEKLAFLGRRVLYLRLSEYLIHRPTSSPEAIDGLDVSAITTERLEGILSLDRIGVVAERLDGFKGLLRWKPKNEGDLEGSGMRKVAAESLMAVVGAIELQYGAAKAKEVVDGKVIPGLRVFEEDRETGKGKQGNATSTAA